MIDIKNIANEFKFPEKTILTSVDENNFQKATHSHICEKELGHDRVRDHCHLTGKFSVAAHNECNLNCRVPKFFPVIFHNLCGYDNHLFIKNIGVTEGNISCIPNNEEKYISFSKELVIDTYIDKEKKEKNITREIRFIDSFKFMMASSLASLSDNLEEFPILSSYYKGRKLELLHKKEVYPYEYMDCSSKLDDKQLPPIEICYSHLNGEDISGEDYKHAQTVWE